MEENKNLNRQLEKKEKKNKNKLATWWFNLKKPAKIGICAVGAIVLSSAIIFPTLGATIWKKEVKEQDIKFDISVDLKWCEFNCFSNEYIVDPPMNVQLGQNVLLKCDFSIIPSGFDYTEFNYFKDFSESPEICPCYEKIEFDVNGKKLTENQYTQTKLSESEDPGYNRATITDKDVLNTFDNKTIVKIRLINCVQSGDTSDTYYLGTI